MMHVVNNLCAFLMFEVLETSWVNLQVRLLSCLITWLTYFVSLENILWYSWPVLTSCCSAVALCYPTLYFSSLQLSYVLLFLFFFPFFFTSDIVTAGDDRSGPLCGRHHHRPRRVSVWSIGPRLIGPSPRGVKFADPAVAAHCVALLQPGGDPHCRYVVFCGFCVCVCVFGKRYKCTQLGKLFASLTFTPIANFFVPFFCSAYNRCDGLDRAPQSVQFCHRWENKIGRTGMLLCRLSMHIVKPSILWIVLFQCCIRDMCVVNFWYNTVLLCQIFCNRGRLTRTAEATLMVFQVCNTLVAFYTSYLSISITIL